MEAPTSASSSFHNPHEVVDGGVIVDAWIASPIITVQHPSTQSLDCIDKPTQPPPSSLSQASSQKQLPPRPFPSPNVKNSSATSAAPSIGYQTEGLISNPTSPAPPPPEPRTPSTTKSPHKTSAPRQLRLNSIPLNSIRASATASSHLDVELESTLLFTDLEDEFENRVYETSTLTAAQPVGMSSGASSSPSLDCIRMFPMENEALTTPLSLSARLNIFITEMDRFLANRVALTNSTRRDEVTLRCLQLRYGWTVREAWLNPPLAASFIPFQYHRFWVLMPPSDLSPISSCNSDLENEGSLSDRPILIVDFHFLDLFRIARPTSAFTRVLGKLSSVFVGTPEELCRVVRFVATEMKRSLETESMPIPPWRQGSFLESGFAQGIISARNSPSYQFGDDSSVSEDVFTEFEEMNKAFLQTIGFGSRQELSPVSTASSATLSVCCSNDLFPHISSSEAVTKEVAATPLSETASGLANILSEMSSPFMPQPLGSGPRNSRWRKFFSSFL